MSLPVGNHVKEHSFRVTIEFKYTKGVRWMPWHRKAMKDADGCDKLRGGA